MWFRLAVIVGILILIDLYFFQSVKIVLHNLSPERKKAIYLLYWMITALSIAFVFSFRAMPDFGPWKGLKLYGLSFVFIILVCKIFGNLPLIVDDLIRLIKWLSRLVSVDVVAAGGGGISRSKFLSQLAILFASIPFITFLYGMIRVAFNYKVVTEKIILPELPETFNGLKIVQISDLHLGSFTSTNPIEEAVDLIMKQKPDIVLFTGDMVNNKAEEAEDFIEVLSKIKAPLGKFSILGNHDYGHYVKWKSEGDRLENLKRLKAIHKEMGWDLLLNENRIIEKDGAILPILGVENWSGVMRFHQYGDLVKAVVGIEDLPNKLLLSHDPSHWKAEVVKGNQGIALTFSGHTHGMQFGIDIPGLRWSPVQYVYKQWKGLYKDGGQYLYVNPGLGFIGYMGRVGILPEITVFELYRS